MIIIPWTPAAISDRVFVISRDLLWSMLGAASRRKLRRRWRQVDQTYQAAVRRQGRPRQLGSRDSVRVLP